MTPGQRPAKAEVSEADRKWLACLLDCEGSISFRGGEKVKHKDPNIDINNTNVEIMQEALRVMQSITNHPIPSPYEGNSDRGYKPCWRFRIGHHGAIEDLLKAIFPYLIVKSEQARLMLRFLEITPFRVFGRRGAFKGRRRPSNVWTSEHFEIMSCVRLLNRRFPKGEWAKAQRTTERPAPPEWRMKKRSDPVGNYGSQSEMVGRLAQQKLFGPNGEVLK